MSGARRGGVRRFRSIDAVGFPMTSIPRLELRQRLTGAPTGRLSVLLPDPSDSYASSSRPSHASPSASRAQSDGASASDPSVDGSTPTPIGSQVDGPGSGSPVHVAYPSGDAVVVMEVRCGRAPTGGSPHVMVIGPDDTDASRHSTSSEGGGVDEGENWEGRNGSTTCAWAPAATHGGLLAVGSNRSLRLYAPVPEHHPEPGPSLEPPLSPTGGDGGESPAAASGPSTEWERVTRVALDAAVTGMAWTEDGGGILVATRSGAVQLWRAWRAGDEERAPGAGDPDRGEGGEGGEGEGMVSAWRGRAAAAQSIVAAGATTRADATHATAGPGAARALIWRTATGDRGDVRSGSGASGTATGALRDLDRGPDQELTHPSPVTAMQWRPRFVDGSGEEDDPGGAPGRRGERGDEGGGGRRDALLTVAADGAVRMWMSAPPPLAPPGAPSTPSPMIMVLVVQADPVGPRGCPSPAPPLLAARWISSPEIAPADAAGGAAGRQRGTRDRGARGSGTDAIVVPGDGRSSRTEYLAALGADGAVWVWVLTSTGDGGAGGGGLASPRLPRAHLWRRVELCPRGSAAATALSPPCADCEPISGRRRRWEPGLQAVSWDCQLENPLPPLVPSRVARDRPPRILRVVAASPAMGLCRADIDLGPNDASKMQHPERRPGSPDTPLGSPATGPMSAPFEDSPAPGVSSPVTFCGHRAPVTSISVCAQSELVASLDCDGGLAVWRWVGGARRVMPGGCNSDDVEHGLVSVPVTGLPERCTAVTWASPVSVAGTRRESGVLAVSHGSKESAARISVFSVSGDGGAASVVAGPLKLSAGVRSLAVVPVTAVPPPGDDEVEEEEEGVSGGRESGKKMALVAVLSSGAVLSWLLSHSHTHAGVVSLGPYEARGDGPRAALGAAGVPSAPLGSTSTTTHVSMTPYSIASWADDGVVSLWRLDSDAAPNETGAPAWAKAGSLRPSAGGVGNWSKEGDLLGVTAAAPAPCGGRVATAAEDGTVLLWEAEGDADGRFVLESRLEGEAPGGASGKPGAVHLGWFDAGAGAAILAVGKGSVVTVYGENPRSAGEGPTGGAEGEGGSSVRKGPEREEEGVDWGGHGNGRGGGVGLAWAEIPGEMAVVGNRGGDAGGTRQAGGIGAMAWTPHGEGLIVSVESELFVMATVPFGSDPTAVPATVSPVGTHTASLAVAAATTTAPLPDYHPSVLLDWLVRGKVGRARVAVRNMMQYLRDVDAAGTAAYGPRPVSITQLLEADIGQGGVSEKGKELGDSGGDSNPGGAGAGTRPPTMVPEFDMGAFGMGAPAGAPGPVLAPAQTPSAVPEFDAGAFGGFAGFAPTAPRTAPALFSFGQDLKPISATSTSSGSPEVGAETPGNRFSGSEVEEGAELVASRGSHLPGLNPNERMVLLGALDALRDADGGVEASVDEAGRRFHNLRRGRQLSTRVRVEGDLDTPQGEELAWALHCDTQDALLSSLLGNERGDGGGGGVTLRAG